MTSFASPAARRSDAQRPFRSAPKAEAPHVKPSSRGLSPDRERELAARILAGDKTARDELVTGNMALCHYFALRFLRWDFHDLEKEDLVQEGSLGLIRAAERYDPEVHGTRFSTYASFWVRNRIRLACMNTGELIRIPVHRHERREASSCRASLCRSNLLRIELPGPSEDRLAEMVNAEDRGRLRKALSRLKPEHRELLRWYTEEYGNGRPTHEKKNCRRNRAHAAKQVLLSIRKRLNPEGSTDA